MAFRVDHEQIDPRDAMPLQEGVETHRRDGLFDQEGFDLRNGRAVFEKDFTI